MSPHIATDAHANRIGAFWMLLAMAGFALEDAFIKAAAGAMPVAQVLVIFGVGGALVFGVMARARGEVILTPLICTRPMVIRAGFEIFGRLFYTLAIALTTLSSATTILQATPIVVVAGAALFFGERVGLRRWVAIGIGLIGVLIVLRPNVGTFEASALLAVLGMLGFAGRDLATRAAPKGLGTCVLGVYGFGAIIVAGVLFGLWEGRAFVALSGVSGAYMAGAVIWGVIAYSGLMRAMRIGAVAVVTPFRYSRLLFGLALAVFAFGETVEARTLLGCALIVAAGIYILTQRKG